MSPFGVNSSFVFTLCGVAKLIVVGVFLSDSTGIGDTQNKRGLGLDISKTGVLTLATWYEGVLGRPERVLEAGNS